MDFLQKESSDFLTFELLLMALAKMYCKNTYLVLFHKLYGTGPNVVLSCFCKSEFHEPTNKVSAQIESCERKYLI